jgi:hypothetical protein
VQELLASKRQGEKTRVHNHFLKTTVACGLCGSTLGVTHSRGKQGVIYPYFFCYGRQKKNGCSLKFLPLKQVENMVESYLKRVQLPAATAERIRAKVTEHVRLMRSVNEREVERQHKRLDALEREEPSCCSSPTPKP